MKTKNIYYLIIPISLLLVSCNAFMHGLTEKKAQGVYLRVTGDKSNFGDRRLKYNKGFHKNSELTAFLACKGRPSMIYEYKTAAKCRGIRLYYPALDSVFIFEEPGKGELRSVLRESRLVTKEERAEFQVKAIS